MSDAEELPAGSGQESRTPPAPPEPEASFIPSLTEHGLAVAGGKQVHP